VSEEWTIGKVLGWTRGYFADKGLENPRFDAELLVAHGLGITRLQLYTEHDKPLDGPELAKIRNLVQRRGRHEPAAYITGERGFWSLDLKVDGRVLIPRPETEQLVERALAFLKGKPQARVVDVGTGSGCIALAIASERPDARITAVDASPDALDVALANRDALKLEVELKQSNLLSAVEGPLDLVVSNPPYVASAVVDQLMPDVRDFEPRVALDGGPDGLVLIRQLIDQAASRLVAGGMLMFEIGYDQGPPALDLMRTHGAFEDCALHPDLAGLDRVVAGVRR
jgi:release factor glutamine methyltransferase